MARGRINRIRKALSEIILPSGNPFTAMLPRSSYNYQRDVGTGLQSSVVVAPLRWILRNFTEATLRAQTYDPDGELQPIPRGSSDPAARMISVIARPNPHYHGGQLWKGTILSYELDGNAYWLKVRNMLGMVIEYYWIPHTLIDPVREQGSANYVDYYRYEPGDGQTYRIAPDDVVHFRDGLDPDNPIKGFNAFKSLLREIFTDDEAANFTASLLRNMGVPGLVVSPASDDQMLNASDEEVQQTKRFFKQATTGDQRGEPIVMTAPTSIKTIGFNPSEMDLKSLRRLPEERVTAVLGVPAIVANLGAGLDRSTFANFKEAREAAAEEKQIPTWRDIALELQHQALPDYTDTPDAYLIDFDTRNVRALKEDEDALALRVTGLVAGGILTVGQALAKMGEPHGPEHDIYLRPMNLIETPAGQMPGEAVAPTDASVDNGDA